MPVPRGYKKRCKSCNVEIMMDNSTNDKWWPLNVNGTLHICTPNSVLGQIHNSGVNSERSDNE